MDDLQKIEKRLRQVLELLVNAPEESTTIRSEDDQGDYVGWDSFVGIELISNAKSLLTEWDKEDKASP